VNGGTPNGGSASSARGALGTSSLRAIRHGPALVDDLGAAPVLAAAAARARTRRRSCGWTRAWLRALAGGVPRRRGDRRRGAVDRARGARGVPTLKGDPDGHRRRRPVALLERPASSSSGDGRARTLAAPLFVAHAAGLEVDWGWAVRRRPARPAALPRPSALSGAGRAHSTPRRRVAPELARAPATGRSRCASPSAGSWRPRARRTEAPGQPARYRLGDAALGRGAPLPSPVSATVAAPAGPGTVAPAPTAGSAPALRLTLGGVTVSLAAGLTAHVAYDADGVPHLTVPPAGDAGR
jgi:hypothetical protein